MLPAVGVLLLASFQLCSAAGMLPGRLHEEKFIRSYAVNSLLKKCFGDEAIVEYRKDVGSMFKECRAEVFKEFGGMMKKKDMDDVEMEENSPMFFSADRVDRLRKYVAKNLRLVACVLDKMNVTVEADGSINGEDLKNEAMKEIFDEKLKGYIGQGYDFCAKQWDCGKNQMYGAQFEDLMKRVNYYRCLTDQHLAACIRFDMDKHADSFDLDPLKDTLEGLDDSHRRVVVASAFANWDRSGLFEF